MGSQEVEFFHQASPDPQRTGAENAECGEVQSEKRERRFFNREWTRIDANGRWEE